MVAGIEVRGSGGNYQLIDNQPTLHWKEKVIRVAEYVTTGHPVTQEVTITASVRAIFVLHSTIAGATLGFATFNSGVWKMHLYCAMPYAGTANVEIHVFDAYLPPLPGQGIQVFDSAGRVTFDANRRPLEIATRTLAKWGWIVNRIGQMSADFGDPAMYALRVELSRNDGQGLFSDWRAWGFAPIPPAAFKGPGVYLTKVNLEGL